MNVVHDMVGMLIGTMGGMFFREIVLDLTSVDRLLVRLGKDCC